MIEIKIGTHNIGRRSPQAFYNKFILPLVSKRQRVKNEFTSLKQIIVNVNNYCNLKCFSCASLCDKPFGENPWRDEPREIDLEDLNQALGQIVTLDHFEVATLTGGEPTAINIDKLFLIARAIRLKGLKVCIYTNGYRIKEIGPNKFDYIVLDDHGTNTEDIKSAIEYFKENRYKKYYVIETKWHRDYDLALRESRTSPGVHCWGWLQPTIWLDVVFPCCHMAQMEGWDNDTILRDSLRKARWVTNNPNLGEVMQDWRNTIPAEVIKKCLFSCWKYREPYLYKNIKDVEVYKYLQRSMK